MLMNLTDIFHSENRTITTEAVFETDTVKQGAEEYKVKKASPVVLTLKNIGKDAVLVHANADVVLSLTCDRCLKEVEYPFELDFEVRVYSPEYRKDEGTNEEDEETDGTDFLDGYYLKVDDLIYSEILLNWPMKILCREDCKGICRICGKDLNTGTCGCDTFVPSPGLAGIKEIFNANKEV